MKKDVLMISIDENILSNQSTNSLERQKKLAKELNSLTIVVYTKKTFKIFKEGNLKIIPTNSGNSKVNALKDLFSFSKKELKKEKYDIITTQDPFFLGSIGLILSKKFKTKFYPQIHIEIFRNNTWYQESLLNKLQYYIGKYNLKKANKIRTVNKFTKNYISKNFNKKVTSIPIATSLGFTEDKFIKKEYDAIFVGRFSFEKNLIFLVEVIFQITKKNPNFKMILVGDGPMRKKIEDKIKELDLEKNFTLTGYKKFDQVNIYLKKSKMFLLPSLSEGWALVAIEANLSGIPVVMTNTGCAGEVIQNNKSGFVCKLNRKQDFIKAINKYYYNYGLRNSHVNEAKKIIFEKYNEEILFNNWVDFLNE
jgi:glycosyltransferase involved in cell wall biosynthesis